MGNLIKPHTFADGESVDALRQNENFDAVVDWINDEAMHRDASTAFGSFPSGPPAGALPTYPEHLANKLYVDNLSGGVLGKAASQNDASGSINTLTQVSGFATVGSAVGAHVTTNGLVLETTGLWIVAAHAKWGSDQNGKRRIKLRKDGVDTDFGKIDSAETHSTTGEGFPLDVVAPIHVTAANTAMSLWAAQDSGSTLQITCTLFAWKVV